jgi:cation transport regulator ChaC
LENQMPQFRNSKKRTVEEEQQDATAPRKPSEQALEVVDVTFGAVPRVAEIVRETVTKLRDPNTRSQELEQLQRRVNTLRDPQTRDSELEALRKRLTAEIEKAKAEGPPRRRKATEQFVEQTRKARQRVGV